MGTNGLETTVVVGKHESIRRYHHTRAETTKIDHAVLDGVIALIQGPIRQLVILLLHRLIDGIGQIVQHPHSLIGLSCEKREVKSEQ